MRRRLRRRCVLAAALVAAVAAGCGGSSAVDGVTVFAASSLTDAFRALDRSATYSFAGSDELATQLREGAPADVFASASVRYAAELASEGIVGEPRAFATNRLVVIVPAGSTAVAAFADVARPGVRLVLGAPGVPIGDYARAALEAASLTRALDNVVSEEQAVKGVVAKVALGDADAGIVYATDAVAVGDDVEVIDVPADVQPRIEYVVAAVTGGERGEQAEAWIERLLGSGGRAALAAQGFGLP